MSGAKRWVEGLDAATWRKLILAVAGVALLIRAVLAIRYLSAGTGGGGYDFRWYRAVGSAARDGNPYTAHLVPPVDIPPLQVLTFAGLGIGAGVPLRTLFMLGDVAIVLIAGLGLKQSRVWRLNLACWIAFNPMLLLIWDITVEDKNLYILCVIAAIAAVQHGRHYVALAAAGTFMLFKYVGGFLVPPIAWLIARTEGWRRAIIAVGALGAIFALSQIPWFPDSLDSFGRRNGRASWEHPGHTTWTILLDKVHLYDPALVKIIIVGGVATAYGLLLKGRIGTVESMTLALIAAFFALPDSSPDRIMLLTVLFILITPLTGAGWGVLWVASTIGALANGIFGWIPYLTGVKTLTDNLTGAYGGVRSVIFSNLVLFAAVAFFAMSHTRNKPVRFVEDRAPEAVPVTT
jgi:hypothetical protein